MECNPIVQQGMGLMVAFPQIDIYPNGCHAMGLNLSDTMGSHLGGGTGRTSA